MIRLQKFEIIVSHSGVAEFGYEFTFSESAVLRLYTSFGYRKKSIHTLNQQHPYSNSATPDDDVMDFYPLISSSLHP